MSKNYKLKKLNTKHVTELRELRINRGEIQGFISNFLLNISSRMEVIDCFRENYRKGRDNQIFKVAVGQYIASIITCWETLFRDVLVFIIHTDKSIYEKVKLYIIENGISITDFESKDITIGEFMSKQYNLQNIDSIGTAFNFLFSENWATIFEYLPKILGKKFYFFSISYIMPLIEQRDSMSKEIEKIIRRAFAIRHKVIHDANFSYDFSPVEMAKMEDCLIMFPQFLMAWLAHRYHQKRLVFNFKKNYIRMTESPSEDEGLYIFGTKEMRMKDWKLVN